MFSFGSVQRLYKENKFDFWNREKWRSTQVKRIEVSGLETRGKSTTQAFIWFSELNETCVGRSGFYRLHVVCSWPAPVWWERCQHVCAVLWETSKLNICTRLSAFRVRIYDYLTKLCRRQAEVVQIHENKHIRSIGKGEARHRKYKRLKLGGGQAFDRSSD
jgi:hypothetical protein